MACNAKRDADGSLILDVNGKVKVYGRGKKLSPDSKMWPSIKDQINIARGLNGDLS